MELPYNTTISSDILTGTGHFTEAVASWSSKRRWVDELSQHSRTPAIPSAVAYTAVRDPSVPGLFTATGFGRALILRASAFASFGHINGVHVQNLDASGPYTARSKNGRLPLNRAYQPTDEETSYPGVCAAVKTWLDPTALLPGEVQC